MSSRYLTATGLDELARQLTGRDELVLQTVAHLRFLSGRQLQRLYFVEAGDPAANDRAARRSLLRLNEIGLLDRLERRVGGVRRGSAGFVYCLAPWGQRLAMHRRWLPERRRRRSLVHGTLFVRHALAVAELHVRLIEGDRAKRFELLELTAEPTCYRSYVGVGGQRLRLKPDSFVRLANGPWEDSFFIEVDRGTEGTLTLERQMKLYVDYHQTGVEQAEYDVFPRVLWLAPDARRAEVIVDAATRLPAQTWQLFQVARFDDALGAMLDDAKTTT
jgi:Replication-relaxation